MSFIFLIYRSLADSDQTGTQYYFIRWAKSIVKVKYCLNELNVLMISIILQVLIHIYTYTDIIC